MNHFVLSPVRKSLLRHFPDFVFSFGFPRCLAVGMALGLAALSPQATFAADDWTALIAASLRFPVRHHEARLTLDPQAQSIQGEVALEAEPQTLGLLPHLNANWHVDVGDLVVDGVWCDAWDGPDADRRVSVPHQRVGAQLILLWPNACRAKAGKPVGRPDAKSVSAATAAPVSRLHVAYHGKPTKGLIFVPGQHQVYTAFSTSQWLPTVDAPDVRATLDLTLVLPRDWAVAVVGEPVRGQDAGQTQPNSSQQGVRHRLTTPTPSYLYGFAAGRLHQAEDDSATPRLNFLGPPSFSEAQLRQIFADTRRMIAFYESKAGMPYALPRYTQVLLNHGAAQEAAGLVLMSEGYGHRVLADGSKTWLGAHELAHQWWGNGLTNRSWTEFWLNEGIASFMTVACLEHLQGSAVYDRIIAATRLKVQQLRQSGQDKPLTFPDWDEPTAADRSVVYDKGALFVHELRALVGEDAFWRGLRQYTQANWSRSVGAGDFQAAMQAASPVDLRPMFDEWVRGSGTLTAVDGARRHRPAGFQSAESGN